MKYRTPQRRTARKSSSLVHFTAKSSATESRGADFLSVCGGVSVVQRSVTPLASASLLAVSWICSRSPSVPLTSEPVAVLATVSCLWCQ